MNRCAVCTAVSGLWLLEGGRGRKKVGKALGCRRVPLHGWPFAEAAGRARLPGTMWPKHNPLLGCVGGAGVELARPWSQQVPLFTALAGLAASPYHGKNPTLLHVIRSDTSGRVCDS